MAPPANSDRTPPTSASKTAAKTPRKVVTVRSQGQAAGSQLVDSLNGLVEDLIRENRRLQRQVEKLSGSGAGTAAAGLERGLKAIQKRIERTLAASGGRPLPAGRRAVAAEPRPRSGSSAPAARSRRKPASN